ncbi:MAG: hypothetical protein FWE31_01925 [Firmicutes bacterium]|nr:hypothetical protein [Bacillota bacterium]
MKGKIASDIVWGCLHNRKLEQAKTQYNPYDEEMYLCETAGATNILYYGDNQTEIINTSMHELRNIGSTISSMVCQGCDNPNPFPECDIDYLQYETILDKTYPDREQL